MGKNSLCLNELGKNSMLKIFFINLLLQMAVKNNEFSI